MSFFGVFICARAVCIMDLPIQSLIGEQASLSAVQQEGLNSPAGIRNYFGVKELGEERCRNIISKSGESLGEYDFYFEWFKTPTKEEINKLKKKIDDKL